MSCNQTQSLMSLYLDGRVNGRQMQSVSQHLAGCDACHAQFKSLRQTQQALAGIRRHKAPPDLAFRIRLAISREAARSPQRRLQALLARFEDAVNGFMVPATAGVLSAVIFFGVLMGFFAVPAQLQAADDTPPMIYSRAVLKSSPFNITDSAQDSVVVEVTVGPNGRVQDYRLISPETKETQELMPLLKNMLIFTEFQPATQFLDSPATDRVVLSFAKINVKG